MSVAFAQQTELARMARQKEVSLSVVQTEIVHQQERHFEIIQKCSEEELDTLLSKEKKKDIKHEELKPLSKELSEESSDIPSLGEQFESTAGPLYMLGPSKQEMKLSVESSSRRTEFELKEILVSIKTLSIYLFCEIAYLYISDNFISFSICSQKVLPLFQLLLCSLGHYLLGFLIFFNGKG